MLTYGCRQTVDAKVSVLLESPDTAAFLAVRMDKGGCQVAGATGVFLWLDSAGFYNVTSDLGKLKIIIIFNGLLMIPALVYIFISEL